MIFKHTYHKQRCENINPIFLLSSDIHRSHRWQFLFIGIMILVGIHSQTATAQGVQTETNQAETNKTELNQPQFNQAESNQAYTNQLQINQTETDALITKLTSIGFENIAVRLTAADLTIAYENRVYRSQHRALAEVLKTVAQSGVTADSLHILMLYREQPMSQLSTSLADLRAMVAGEISYHQWQQGSWFTLEHGQTMEELRGLERVQKTRFRPEILAGLGMRYQLGNYNNPYRFAFDLQPELRLPLPYGVTANVRMAVPLYNNFDQNDFIRPSLITLTYERRLYDGVYASATTGIFTRNRKGWHSMLKAFLWEEVFSVTLEGGQTLFTDLTGNPFLRSFEERDFHFYTASADYRWRRYDMNIRAQYGKFLYEDVGLRVDVHRHFGDALFGFFFMDTRFGNNYGFSFSLPFPQRKSVKAGPVRIRTVTHFPITYHYQGNDYRARSHETGITMREALMEFYPSYLRKEMERWF